MIAEPRRAPAAFALSDGGGNVRQSGEAEAMVEDEGLVVGPVTVSWLDADVVTVADYRVQLDLWPSGRLVLSQLGRRFDTFGKELARVRNRARVAGLLAHGITSPEVFPGAVLSPTGRADAEIEVYDTHVTIVPADGDPWQVPFGAVMAVRQQSEPPAIVLETGAGLTTLGQLGRRREACCSAIVERREAQRRLLADVAGQAGFSDGWGRARHEVAGFDELVARFTAPERESCARTLLSFGTAEPRFGFVQLLDPDPESLESPNRLPKNWAAFLLVPAGAFTVLEILAGPSAATYAFRGEIDDANRHLRELHFRRAPLALTREQAELTANNPYRLALRRLESLGWLRAATVARVVHNDRWADAIRSIG